jgi:fucose permease
MRRLSPSLPDHAGAADGNCGAAAVPLRARISVSVIFFVNGFVVASWVPHIPEVKERLALGDFQLGMALFAMAVGSVLALPVAGWFAGRVGSRAVTRAAGPMLCLLLPAPLVAPSLPILILALLLFGAANGVLDVGMNAQAVQIEDRYPRPILSSLHGLYSAGGLAGASLAALAASSGIPASVQALGLGVILAALSFAATAFLLDEAAGRADRGAVLAWPSRALIGLGALAFLALMAEGAMGDWAAVFLREYRGVGMDGAATGFAGFSLAMAVGRFSGDWARRKWGGATLLRTGGIAAALGMAIALIAPGIVLSVLGFILFGLGLANMIPVLFGAAGRAAGVTAGLGIAAVATAGYGGLLAGPPLIGLTAELVGLRLALGGIVLGMLAIAVFAGQVRNRADRDPASRGERAAWSA